MISREISGIYNLTEIKYFYDIIQINFTVNEMLI